MPLRRECGHRQEVESDVVNEPDPRDLGIQNLCRQVETMTQHLDQTEPRGQLFNRSSYEGDSDFLVYCDRLDDDGDFEDLMIYDDESD